MPASPNPFGDTAARWFYVLVKELLERGHSVSCLVVSEEPDELIHRVFSAFSGFPAFRWQHFDQRPAGHVMSRKLRSLWRPFSEALYADGVRAALKKEIDQGYDILHLEQLWTGWLGLRQESALLNVHHFEIIDWGDRTHLGWRDRKALFQMNRATKKILARSKNVRVFTSRLEQRARELNPAARYWTLPFALDPTLYPFLPLAEKPVVGVFGSMHWHPSRSAGVRLITKIWPLIRECVPNARLLVAGWNARKYLGHLVHSGDVEIVENLAQPTDFFSRASVMCYAPSRGSGMKIKVLEAMAYGVPVVTTGEGVEGIEYSNGVECEVGESDSELAASTVALLQDPDRRDVMRRAARRLVETRYSPKPVVDGLLQIYEDILS